MKNIVNKKKFTAFVLVVFLTLFGYVFKARASAYVVYLYYNVNSNTLTLDKKQTNPVVLDKNIEPDYLDFAQNISTGSYILKFYDINNTEIVSTEFNKIDGAFVLQIPYFSLANTLKVFEKSSGAELFQADLSDYLTCNANGVCEFEKGENLNTCLSDCGSSNVKYSPETQKILDENGGVIKDPKTGGVVLKGGYSLDNSVTAEEQPVKKGIGFGSILLIISIGVAIGITTFLVLRRMRESD